MRMKPMRGDRGDPHHHAMRQGMQRRRVMVPMPREVLRTRFTDAVVAAAPSPMSREVLRARFTNAVVAAATLQKVYKSFRLRSRLADCQRRSAAHAQNTCLTDQLWSERSSPRMRKHRSSHCSTGFKLSTRDIGTVTTFTTILRLLPAV